MNASCRSLGKRAPLVFLKQMLQTAALLAGPGLILPASLLSQEVVPRTAVNVGTYTVEAPEGDDWTTEVDREKGSVKFTRGKQKLLSLLVGGAGGGTSITVFRTRRETDAPGVWLMNESQMADFYRDHQVRLQRESDRPGISSTSDVRKDTVQVDGKRYYRLAYTVTRKGYGAIEMSMSLYFPPAFSRNREFFVFTIMESFSPGSIWASKDFEQINPVLKSLRIIDPLEGVTGPEGELLRACARGDSLRVSELVAQGANVNAAPHGRSPLVIASAMGHEGIVRLLVERGALLSPGGDNEDAWPLSAAIMAKEFPVARYLVEKGANVAARSNTGWSPLTRAVLVHADSAFVSALLRRGAAVNERSESEWTPLIWAAYENLRDLCLVLLARGADASLRSKNGWTALMIAAQNRAPAATQVLLECGANPNGASETGWTAVLAAAGEGDVEILELLSARGADLRARTKRGVSALHLAAYNVHPACVRFLLERGADINEADNDGWTPLMFGASGGDTTVVRLLIEKGAALNAKNAKDHTALEIADDKDHEAVVEMLTKAGAED